MAREEFGPVDDQTYWGLTPPQGAAPSGEERSGEEGAGEGLGSTARSDVPAQQGGFGPSPDAGESSPSSGATPGVGGGRLVGERYRLKSRLKGGGMGTVWVATDEVVRRDVAIKEPRVPEQLGEAERDRLFERMLREARSAASIEHPNVVTVFDLVVEEGRPWIVMELVRGTSLESQLDEGTLTPRDVARTILPVLDALSSVHEQGVLHRDVKPANVLLGRHDRVVLTDFGIARVDSEQAMTETGAVMGSPEFVSPERVNGQRPGPPSDLWALGVLLYTAVEGWSPFRRNASMATMLAVRDDALPPPSKAGPLAGVITALLDKDPARRPTVEQVRHALKTVAEPPAAAPAALSASGQSSATRVLTSLLHPGRDGSGPPWWRRSSRAHRACTGRRR